MISGRISMIAHQLSLRDTTNHGGGNPGLNRPGYHQVPLRGKSQWAFLAERGLMVAGGFNPRKRHAQHPPRRGATHE